MCVNQEGVLSFEPPSESKRMRNTKMMSMTTSPGLGPGMYMYMLLSHLCILQHACIYVLSLDAMIRSCTDARAPVTHTHTFRTQNIKYKQANSWEASSWTVMHAWDRIGALYYYCTPAPQSTAQLIMHPCSLCSEELRCVSLRAASIDLHGLTRQGQRRHGADDHDVDVDVVSMHVDW